MSENWTFQYSGKAGNDMLNVRADTAEELSSNLDALFGAGTGKDLVARFFVQQAFGGNGAAVPGEVRAVPSPSDNAPTEKQIKFAKTLGIQNADKLTKRELSAEIDRRKK